MLYNNKLTRAVVLSYLTLPPGTNAPQTCRVAGRTGNERRVDIVISCANKMLGLLLVASAMLLCVGCDT